MDVTTNNQFSKTRTGTGTREWSEHSYNIQKGCKNNCIYCVSPNTLITMSDLTIKKIVDIKVGDCILGFDEKGSHKRIKKSIVEAKTITIQPAYEITFQDGIKVICSGNHRWLSNRGWKYTIGNMCGENQRPYLTTNNSVRKYHGIPKTKCNLDENYMKGYLSGMIKGDGLLKMFDYSGKRRKIDVQYQFRLALKDDEALERTEKYLLHFGITVFKHIFTKDMNSIRTTKKSHFDKIHSLIEFIHDHSFYRGYLSGLFDAEGGYTSVPRLYNSDINILNHAFSALKYFHFNYSIANAGKVNKQVKMISLKGGVKETVRFFQTINCAIKRKPENIYKYGSSIPSPIKISSIKKVSDGMKMIDIQTSTKTFFANNIASHNCYARYDAIKRYKRVKDTDEWQEPIINMEKVNKKWKKVEGVIMFPTIHDITEENIEHCITTLLNILEPGNKVLIVSKPDKNCIQKIIIALGKHKKQIMFRFTIGSTKELILKRFELNAPNFSSRLISLQIAFNAGFKTSISAEPLLGNKDTLTNILEYCENFVTDDIWVGKMNKINQRIFGYISPEQKEAIKIIGESQEDDRIQEMYEMYKDHPKIKWKDSIKKVIGIN